MIPAMSSRRVLLALLVLVGCSGSAAAQTYTLRVAADGGAAAGTGGAYELAATIGQPAASDVSAPATFTVAAGFWPAAVAPPNLNLIRNRSFDQDAAGWLQFATPDASYMVSAVNGGVFEFFRQPPPPGTAGQAVVFQPIGEALTARAAIEASFELGNSSTVRKRVSVLMHDRDFSDLFVCTFWLPPNSPLSAYGMRTHTTRAWRDATISFYAATPGSDGGVYRIDNVTLAYAPAAAADRTDCLDPTTPAPPGGADGPDLIGNGDFSAGALAPWATFGQIVHQVAAGVFEFYRPAGTPAGVLLQDTAQPAASGTRLTSTFELGNSSGVRKRVTVLLHDKDFTDLSACTFWLAPGQPLQPYAMKSFATRPWTRATLSIYGATVGVDAWTRVDNATLRTTPSVVLTGTECIESGAAADVSAPAPAVPAAASADVVQRVAAAGRTRSRSTAQAAQSSARMAAGDADIRVLDLRWVTAASVQIEPPGQGRSLRLAISTDAITWVNLAVIAAPAVVNLDDFAGQVVYLQLIDRERR
jgi:hypothetical protein